MLLLKEMKMERTIAITLVIFGLALFLVALDGGSLSSVVETPEPSALPENSLLLPPSIEPLPEPEPDLTLTPAPQPFPLQGVVQTTKPAPIVILPFLDQVEEDFADLFIVFTPPGT